MQKSKPGRRPPPPPQSPLNPDGGLDSATAAKKMADRVAVLSDFEAVLEKVLTFDEEWVREFVEEHQGIASLSRYIRHPTTLESVRLCCLAILCCLRPEQCRQHGGESLINSAAWILRTDESNISSPPQQQAAATGRTLLSTSSSSSPPTSSDAICVSEEINPLFRRCSLEGAARALCFELCATVGCGGDRETALLWMRQQQRACRESSLLGRCARGVEGGGGAEVVSSMKVMQAWGNTGDAMQQMASKREMLLLGMHEKCRQMQRRGSALVATQARSLLLKMRGGTAQLVTTVSVGGGAEETLQSHDTAGDVEDRLAGGRRLLWAGCVPQSGVWCDRSLQVGSLGMAQLRCEVWPQPWHVDVKGPLRNEMGCALDPRMDGARAAQFILVGHVEDEAQGRGMRLKLANGGPWLDLKERLDKQCRDGCAFELKVPPATIPVEMLGEQQPRNVTLVLSQTVHELLQTLRAGEDCGIWMRESGSDNTTKKWLEEDQTLQQCGVDEKHVLRCEPRPRVVFFRLGSAQFTLEVMHRDLIDVVIKRACKLSHAPRTPSSYRLYATGKQHALFGWESLSKQGVDPGEILTLTVPPDSFDSIYLSASNPPSIWDDVNVEKDQVTNAKSGDLEAASLNAIVHQMTSVTSSVNTVQMFLYTYHSFCTADTLLRLLIQRSRVPTTASHEDRRTLGVRVLGVLKQWLDVDPFLPGPVVDNMVVFCERDLSQNHDMQTALRSLRNALLRWTRGEVRKYHVLESAPEPLLPSKQHSIRYRDISPLEIARQVTLSMSEKYGRLEARELFGQAWAKEKTQSKCPNVMSLIELYNGLAARVATSVVLADTVRRRVKMTVHHLQVCVELRKMQNYHALSAYISGLANASILRLKHTKEALPKKWQRTHEELQDLCNMQGSFHKLRDALLHGDPPKLPYLGMYLADLTFIEDGNPDKLTKTRAGTQEQVELIHVSKLALLHRILSTIQTWQAVPYNFTRVDQINRILNIMVTIDDKQLYAESLLREPRDADRSQVK